MGLSYTNINDVLSELSGDEQVEWLVQAFSHNVEILKRAAQKSAQRIGGTHCPVCGSGLNQDGVCWSGHKVVTTRADGAMGR